MLGDDLTKDITEAKEMALQLSADCSSKELRFDSQCPLHLQSKIRVTKAKLTFSSVYLYVCLDGMCVCAPCECPVPLRAGEWDGSPGTGIKIFGRHHVGARN